MPTRDPAHGPTSSATGRLTGVDIRLAHADDIPAINALWASAAGPTRLASDDAAVERLLARDPEALIVAEVDGVIVGTVIVGWDGWRCHLYRMAVDPSARRSGVATTLVAAARATAARHGARRLDAMVDDANAGAHAFWSALGFERDDHDRRWSVLLETRVAITREG